MLSYRHRFHAGNFADVVKHAVLSRALALLAGKDKPMAYLDTHAGVGGYDLSHPWSRKNAEHRAGIGRLWQRDDVPLELQPYLQIVRRYNTGSDLERYPGSPLVAAGLLREQDRLVLCELNRDDCATLKECLARDRRAGVHHLDASLALKAFLPPRERRGLVLMDSPFDRAGEFDRLVAAVASAHRRWATGTLAAWYPLMDERAMSRFESALAGSKVRRILQVEVAVHATRPRDGLRGCGMVLVNPPFGLDLEARAWTQWLWRALSPRGEGGARVRWLVPE